MAIHSFILTLTDAIVLPAVPPQNDPSSNYNWVNLATFTQPNLKAFQATLHLSLIPNPTDRPNQPFGFHVSSIAILSDLGWSHLNSSLYAREFSRPDLNQPGLFANIIIQPTPAHILRHGHRVLVDIHHQDVFRQPTEVDTTSVDGSIKLRVKLNDPTTNSHIIQLGINNSTPPQLANNSPPYPETPFFNHNAVRPISEAYIIIQPLTLQP